MYINEAHPCDGGGPTDKTIENELFTHTTWESRRDAAAKFVGDMNLTIPCLIDNLDNAADLAYQAWPDKVYVVRSDGVIAVAGEDGPFGFPKAFEDAESWLSEYRQLGFEPAIIKTVRDFNVMVAAELKPTGHQDELLARLKQFREQNPIQPDASVSPTDDEEATSASTTPVTKTETAVSEVAEADKPFRVKPWHIFVAIGSVLGIGLLAMRFNGSG